MPIHSANRPRRRESFPAPPSSTLIRNIAYTFTGITVAIVVAALWMSSVRATVVIKASREPRMVEASVDVARSPQQGQLPGRAVQGVFEQIQEFETGAAGGTAVDSIATGKVRIVNNYSAPQPLVKTTRLLTSDGRLYRIDRTVNVPSKGSVEVEAYADKAGAQFEFTSKTQFSIPGLSESLQKWITAESVTSFVGGTRTVKAVSQADIDAARTQLEAKALEQAKKTLLAEAADNRFRDGVYLVKPLETKSSVQIGEETDRFLYSVKLDVTGVFYSREDMEQLLKEKLEQGVSEGREITGFDTSKAVFTVSRVSIKDETATIGAKAEVQTALSDDSPDLPIDLILGLSIDEAERKLRDVPGIEDATVTVRPAWVRRVPTLKDHVTFKVE